MNIGIFDSGIGGITLLHQALAYLPNERYIFYADTDNVPYGTKTRDEFIQLADNALRFLIGSNCKAVVIACNTATAAAAQILRGKYDIPIIGIEPAIKPAVAQSHGKRVLVAATPLTVREEKLKNLVARVDDEHLVELLALPRLVEFAERGEFMSDDVTAYLSKELSAYELDKYGELVLGCTHFNYFKDTFRRLLPDGVQMIDGKEGTIRQLERMLRANNCLASPQDNAVQDSVQNEGCARVRYFHSGREVTDADGLAYIERLHERLEKMEQIR